MKNRLYLLVILLTSLILIGVGVVQLKREARRGEMERQRVLHERVYREVVVREDWETIVDGYGDVEVGMSEDEVEGILGEPDQVHELYEPVVKKAKVIGESWFYMKWPREEGRGDVEVVVRFDLDGKVMKVDAWGIGE
ncbi:hypothetical protein JD969_14560 [Planctomycetota bacterium]|nr:hypothetical protein JD969_14560 [Planctomycetota bacterium]